MAVINQLKNQANVIFNGVTVLSNLVSTALSLPPTLLKAVDKLIANIGDTLTYTVTITNLNINPINNLDFADVLPDGCTFVNGSFNVNGTVATPSVTNNTLTYVIPQIAALGTAAITFQVEVIGGTQ